VRQLSKSYIRAMRRSALFAALTALSCAGPAPVPVNPADVPPRLKLPRHVRPLHYALDLIVVPEAERFQGQVAIEVEVQRPTASFWLHSLDLTVREASVEVAGERRAVTLTQLTPEGVARVEAAAPIPAGRATLRVAFEGAWNPHLEGLYRVRSGGAAYAYTQLEAIDARRVFPGFDEPAFKTPFDVALQVPEDEVALSNAPAAGEERLGNGLKRVRFATTPPLPTYLVFAAVGPFDLVTPPPLPPNEVRARPLPIRAAVPRGTGARFAFLLEATRDLVPLLERWFGIPFPYEKLDQVISPDFPWGGMENAGAILFSDERAAFEPGRSGEEKRVAVGRLLAHELSHQWFGDLVTLDWWEDVWLNESFATFMAWKAVERWRPDAHQPEEVAIRVDEAMQKDALAGARAVRQPLRRMDDVNDQFDALSYAKGASVLRTFERFMGEERFREAIHSYLGANAHGTGTTDAVLAALSRSAGRDLGPAFHSFLDQPGAPLVDARAVCDAAGPRLEVDVTRYRPVGSRAGPGGPFAVPVCARYEAGGTLGEACTLVERGHGTLPLPACPRWVMPAAGGTAYYRWALDPADLARLRDAGFAHLARAERVSYGQALRAAARAGRLPYGDALAALAPLSRDGARRVATSPVPALDEALDHLVPLEARVRARGRAADLLRPRLRELGLEPADGEPLERRRLRADLAEFLVQVARDPETTRALAAAGIAYAGLPDGRFHPEAVCPDLAETALAAAVMGGDPSFFDALERRLHATEDGEERARILAALGAARDPVLSSRALALASDPRLRVHERGKTLLAQAEHPETREAAWKALQSGWDAISSSMATGLAEKLPDVAAKLCDRARVPVVQKFLTPRVEHMPGARRRLAEALESIELCAALKDAQGASAAKYFAPPLLP
jgi:cytosol alanyl aminopeptidase